MCVSQDLGKGKVKDWPQYHFYYLFILLARTLCVSSFVDDWPVRIEEIEMMGQSLTA